MNTPATTMVAAWMSAETGVGPAMASGSQVWSTNWPDLLITAVINDSDATSSTVCDIKPWLAMVLGVLFTGTMAYLIGKVIFRLSGHYLALATLGGVAGLRVARSRSPLGFGLLFAELVGKILAQVWMRIKRNQHTCRVTIHGDQFGLFQSRECEVALRFGQSQ